MVRTSKNYSFVFFTFLVFISTQINPHGMYSSPHYHMFDRGAERMRELVKNKRKHSEALQLLFKELGAQNEQEIHQKIQEALRAAGQNQDRIKQLNEAYSDLEAYGKAVKNAEITPSKLIARGIAGKDSWEALENVDINNISQGLLHGITIRSAQALGDVLNIRIKDVLEHVVGSACDKSIDSVITVANSITNHIFHGGHKAFSLDQLRTFKLFVKSTYEDLEKMLRDGVRDSLRGYDMTSRQNDNNTDHIQAALAAFSQGAQLHGESSHASDNPKEALGALFQESQLNTEDPSAPPATVEKQGSSLSENIQMPAIINPWKLITHAYVQQFKRFSDEIEMKKKHYKNDSLSFFYAEQIQQQLTQTAYILDRSKSLVDLDSLLGSSKVIVNAIKQNIDRLFQSLEEQIRPRNSQKDSLLSSQYDLRGSGAKKESSDGLAGWGGGLGF